MYKNNVGKSHYVWTWQKLDKCVWICLSGFCVKGDVILKKKYAIHWSVGLEKTYLHAKIYMKNKKVKQGCNFAIV